MKEVNPAESISRAARLYQRGVICPAELWNQVTDRLVPDEAVPFLDGLGEDVRSILKAAYSERPWSLRLETEDDPIRRAVECWCLVERP